MSHPVFFVIQRAGRWQVFAGDDPQPLAVQDSEAAAEQWCRAREPAAVVYHGHWWPRRETRRSA